MNISEFKSILHAGEAKFTYRKKDGSIREARGTLNEALIPKTEKTIRIKCSNIEWDLPADDKSVPRPDSLDVDFSADDPILKDEAKLEAVLAESLAAQGPSNVLTYEYKLPTARKLKEGTIFYYDLDKAGFRSFNESQLVSYENEVI